MVVNRLNDELSPYLLQHAHNPVFWYPWGEEAISLARERNIPIFLSIGYAACHWCHVMESECFMDEEVARLLNTHFISIKVDREERPDIDRIYMNTCQMMTGSGGWPLSMVLTPDLKPFYAATYIPKYSRKGMPGMLDVLPYLADIWETRRDEVFSAGEKIFGALTEIHTEEQQIGNTRDLHLHELISVAYHSLVRLFDPRNGGFSRAPKFPSITQISFLFNYSSRYHNKQAQMMAMKTLSSMAYGGIRDHIGYGFHRYATDEAWNIPHFEKMLYDQALNAIAYTQAWQREKVPLMRECALECCRYMCEILQSPQGGFSSSEDADSIDGEGAYYFWQTETLKQILNDEEFEDFEKVFRLNTMEIPEHAGIAGNMIVSRAEGTDDISQIRKKLYSERMKRPHPPMDDKVLTDWNGLAIEALATAFMVFHEPWIITSAEKAASFLLKNLMSPEGILLHRWREGNAAIAGTSQDYICAASGFLRLFQSTGKPEYLKVAITLCENAEKFFSDPRQGGYFATRHDDHTVPVQLRDDYDGPIPSVNGHAYQVLRTLAVITGREGFSNQAERLITGMIQNRRNIPLGMLSLLSASLFFQTEIRAVIGGNVKHPEWSTLYKELTSRFIPGLIIIPVCPSSGDELIQLIPWAQSVLNTPEPSVWICTKGTCRPPVSRSDELKKMLEEI
jgi:hypothetical protein